jgi:DNA-binding transcriptional ArsR family regulator
MAIHYRVRVKDELAEEADACAESGPAAAASLFRSLADPARLRILQHLALGEHRVVDLTAHLGLAQSTTSAHLACLRDCGLISARTVGRASMYSLAVEGELMGLFAAAERLLAVTGDAVTLCPSNHGLDSGSAVGQTGAGQTGAGLARDAAAGSR